MFKNIDRLRGLWLGLALRLPRPVALLARCVEFHRRKRILRLTVTLIPALTKFMIFARSNGEVRLSGSLAGEI